MTDDTPEPESAPQTLDEALLAFQSDPPQLIAEAEAVILKDGKKLYDYKYLDLASLLGAMRPKLAGLGLLWKTKSGFREDGKPTLFYTLKHVPSGEADEGEMPLIVGGTMQALGGAYTFARRYALVIVFNLAIDGDDDGASANQTAEPEKLTAKMAGTLVDLAEKAGDLQRLQLAASSLIGSDVGDCSTKAKAVKAMQKLSVPDGEKLYAKLTGLITAGGESA